MSATNQQINELAEQAQAFLPQAAEAPLRNFLSLAPTTSSPYTPKQPLAERRPSSGFLSLAPAVSASYPQPPRSRHQSVSHLTRPLPLTHGPTPAEALVPMSAPSPTTEPKYRRSSSTSSDASNGPASKARLRYLKLGPVHWGEHQGEDKGDWHYLDEEAVA